MLETGEAREVHHHCLLVGYGADAINPYMAFEALYQARRDGVLGPEWTDEAIVAAYRKGVAKGMLKVMGKMGISTLQSYKGAQIFEAIGIDNEVIDRCFVGTASRIRGIGFDVIAEESIRRHEIGFPLARAVAARRAAQSRSLPVAEERRKARLASAYHRRDSASGPCRRPVRLRPVLQTRQ